MRRIVFVTGTRADFGKLKPLIHAADDLTGVEVAVFVTGMHMLRRYGLTINEVRKLERALEIYPYVNQSYGEPMDVVLANTIQGVGRYLAEYGADMIVVHGDRAEALAGAISGSLRNVLVAHVEGGEVSGTIDGLIRHSVSKLAHLHFVANDEARIRLLQLGEADASIFKIGSPDIDVMLSPSLPSLDVALRRYDISFREYGVAAFHPVTTELAHIAEHAAAFVDALLDDNLAYVVIAPNNDPGNDAIFDAYRCLEDNPRFRIFPSIRFEHFLTLLRHAEVIVGNSSAGIREAPVYGTPSVNVGTRQRGRSDKRTILDVGSTAREILTGLRAARDRGRHPPDHRWGVGDSARQFATVLQREDTWTRTKDKVFVDLVATS